MKAGVISIGKAIIQEAIPPTGQYPGLIGGNSVSFIAGNESYIAITDQAVRGINISCVVTVNDGKVSVEI
jgi:hypothetical protein